jgi:hypothetical protein
VHYRDLSPAPRTFRRPAASAVAVQRARQVNAAPGAQCRPEREAARIPRAPGHAERSHADHIPNDRSQVEGSQVERIPGDRIPRRPIDLGQVGRIAGERSYVERIPGDRISGGRIPSDHNPGNRGPIDRSHVDRGPGERIARDRIPNTRSPIDRSHVERIPSDRSYADRNEIDRKIERSRIRLEPEWRPAPPRSGLERGVLLVSAGLIVGAAGCFWLL